MPRRALGLPGPIHERLVFLDALHHHPLNSQRVNFLILSLNLHFSWEWLLNPSWVFFPITALLCFSPQLKGKLGTGQDFVFSLLCPLGVQPSPGCLCEPRSGITVRLMKFKLQLQGLPPTMSLAYGPSKTLGGTMAVNL